MSIGLRARVEGPDVIPPLLLLHELGGSSASFRWLVRELADRRTVAVDLPGSGKSPLLAADASGIADHAEAVWCFARETIGQPVVIVGVAFGAALGAIVAARHPKDVAGLVYCCMGPDIPLDTQRFLLERNGIVERQGMGRVVDLSLERSFPSSLRREREEVFAEYAADLSAARRDGYVRQSKALACAGDRIRSSLASLRAPVAVVAGRQDGHFTPAVMRELSTIVHDLTAMESIDDCAHLPHVQAPARLAAITRDLVRRLEEVRT